MSDDFKQVCEPCGEVKVCLMIPTGFAGEHEAMCADCIGAQFALLEQQLEEAKLASPAPAQQPETQRAAVPLLTVANVREVACRTHSIWVGEISQEFVDALNRLIKRGIDSSESGVVQ